MRNCPAPESPRGRTTMCAAQQVWSAAPLSATIGSAVFDQAPRSLEQYCRPPRFPPHSLSWGSNCAPRPKRGYRARHDEVGSGDLHVRAFCCTCRRGSLVVPMATGDRGARDPPASARWARDLTVAAHAIAFLQWMRWGSCRRCPPTGSAPASCRGFGRVGSRADWRHFFWGRRRIGHALPHCRHCRSGTPPNGRASTPVPH